MLYSSPSGIILVIINSLAAVVTVATTVAVFYYRKRRVMVAASPTFCLLILTGCLLGHAIIYTLPLLPTDNICRAQPIVEITAYTLVMCNIGIKTFRIHRIFNSPAKNKLNRKDPWIQNHAMLTYVAVACMINFAIFASWYATDVPKAIQMVDSSGTLFWGCSSSSDSVQSKFNGILVAYQIAITLAALYYGMQVKYITVAEFNESKYIVMAIYTISIMSIILLPIIFLGDSLAYTIRQVFAGIIGAILCAITSFVLFSNKIQVAFTTDPKNDRRASTMPTQTASSGGGRSSISHQWTTQDRESSSLIAKDNKFANKIRNYEAFSSSKMKKKSQMAWELCDIYVLYHDKAILARRMNQSVVTFFDLRLCDGHGVTKNDAETTLSFSLSGEVHLIKFENSDKYERAFAAMSGCFEQKKVTEKE
ncbi:hypothetical protein HDU76_004777 [Blyttiomyces sp. JEL0837]|nr:hypothetical protein HDU76_004777 [Blyttiomyces sp. JEL0837]